MKPATTSCGNSGGRSWRSCCRGCGRRSAQRRCSPLSSMRWKPSTASKGIPTASTGCTCLLDAQPYRLASWRTSAEEINYRRFFDVNDLVGLRMENPEVFAATHCLIRSLIASHQVTGLRIDHCDGMFNPRQYLIRLQLLYLASQCAGRGAAAGDRRQRHRAQRSRSGARIRLVAEPGAALHRGGEDPGAARIPAAGVAGARHLRLRFRLPGQRHLHPEAPTKSASMHSMPRFSATRPTRTRSFTGLNCR